MSSGPDDSSKARSRPGKQESFVQRIGLEWNQIFSNLISIYETLKPIIPEEKLALGYSY